MSESLRDLGDRPNDESFAAVEWDARHEAYRQVLAEARAGEIVPHMSLELKSDGSAEYRVLREDKDDEHRHTGRWTADSTCQTMMVDLENDDQQEPSIVRVEGDRLVFRGVDRVPAWRPQWRGLRPDPSLISTSRRTYFCPNRAEKHLSSTSWRRARFG